MKKTIILFLALIVGICNGYAENPEGTTDLKDLTVTFGSHAWGQWSYPWTFNSSNYAGDGNGDAASSYVDVSAYSKVSIEISSISGTSSGLRAFLWDDKGGKVVTLWFHKSDEVNPDYTTSSNITESGIYCVEFGRYSNLKGIKLPYGATAEYTIDAAYCTPKAYPLGCTDVRDLIPSKGYSEKSWKQTLVYPKQLDSEHIIGNGDGSNESDHMDVHEYESITFVVSEVEAGKTCSPRFWMWDHKTSSVVTLYAYPEDQYESTSTWTTAYPIAAPGTYKVNLSGYKYLKGIKPNYGNGSITVSMMYATPKSLTPIKTTLMSGTATSSLTKVDGHQWNSGTFPVSNFADNTALCGDGSNNGNNIADITGYNYIVFAITKASGNNYFRTWVCDTPGQNPATQLFPHKLSEVKEVADWTSQSAITEPGIYVVNIEGYKYLNGVKSLQTWAGNNGTCDVAAMRLLTTLDDLENVHVSLDGNVYEDNTGDLATWVNWFGNMIIDATDVEEGAELLDPYSLKTVKDNSVYDVTFSGDVINNANNLVNNGTCANLVIKDGEDFSLPTSPMTFASISYDRTFTAAYSTVCLPFAATFTGTAYEFGGNEGTTVTFTPVSGTTLEAGKAYLVSNDFAVTGGSGALAAPASDAFKGTYTAMTVPAGTYGFSGGEFKKVGANVTCKPFRAYLDLTSSAKALNVSFGETAINNIVDDLNNAENIYGVNGARQDGLQKGINIIKLSNGATRKVVIK